MLNDYYMVGEDICNSQINNSPSKMMFSFGKAERFPLKVQTEFKPPLIIKSLPRIKKKTHLRGVSLGYGKRFDISTLCPLSPMGFYSNRSDFDQNNPHSPRFSFGAGREQVPNGSFITKDNGVPGVGNYSLVRKFGAEAPRVSMKGSRSKEIEEKYITPGPGPIYDVANKPLRNLVNSRFKNCRSVDFGKVSPRFKRSSMEGPSPVDYQKLENFGGFHVESRYRNHNGLSIPRSVRYRGNVFGTINSNPGPGAYQVFSEFGIYGRCSLDADRYKRRKFRLLSPIKLKTDDNRTNNNLDTSKTSRKSKRQLMINYSEVYNKNSALSLLNDRFNKRNSLQKLKDIVDKDSKILYANNSESKK